MSRWACLSGAVVTTVVESPTRPTTRGEWVAASYDVGPGFVWDGTAFTPPAAAVPPQVSMRQARLALLAAGKLALVDAAIDAMDEPARSAARIEWEYSSAVIRRGPLVAALAPAIGLNDALVDALFVDAARL